MLSTEWGQTLDPNRILPEYPRPQMVRSQFTYLNGPWDYAITDSDNCPELWDGTILVPFSPEAPLSGVERDVRPGDRLWYRRNLDETPKDGQRLLLHFGAVDQMATVFLNGHELGSHIGGYTPFTFDLTPWLLERDNILTVSVQDLSDTCELSRGKQKTKRGGIWYTRQSGIWQTVWTEWVPETYISALNITPDFDNSQVILTVCSARSAICYVSFDGGTYGCRTNTPLHITLPQFTPWSPENPKLYPFSVTLGADRVESYFAMRKIELKQDGAGIPRLFLNGRPYFQTGVLDQGYWPDGLYTAPSDEALVRDIEMLKSMGFNMLRKHIKVEPLRFYYHCDRLGMLVWQDMPSGGGKYRTLTISAPLITGRHRDDHNYRAFARQDERARKHFLYELREIVSNLYNSPCIVLWVPFNEGWGQFESREIMDLLRKLDPTRLIDHASGWHDQGVSDVKSLHVYFKPYRFRPDKAGRAVVLSEFGGYTLALPEHCWNEKAFGYKRFTDSGALLEAFQSLYETQILPAIPLGLCAAVYTQLSDVEDECNGLSTYDRAVVKLPADAVHAINQRLQEALEP